MQTSAIPGLSGVGSRSSSLLRVVSPAELDEQDRQELAAASEASRPRASSDLTAFVHARWTVFRNHRNSGDNAINERLLRAQRMFDGRYDPQKLNEIRKFGGSEVYSRLVAVKCRGATSLLRDVYLGAERPWDIEAQPDPPVPPDVRANIVMLLATEVGNMQAMGQPVSEDQAHMRYLDLMQAAQQAARRNAMERAVSAGDKVNSILEAGGFYDAFAQFLTDLPLFPFAVLKGPVVRMVPKLVWANGRPSRQNRPQMFWERVDPFNLYWTPGVSKIEDAEVIERKRYTRADLNDLLGLPGFDQEAVRAALNDYDFGLRDWMDSTDTEAALNVGRESPNFNQSMMIDGIEYHGNVQGKTLLDQGVDPRMIPDLDRDYAVQTWVVGRHTIKTQLNPSPRQRHPYFLTSFEKVPGTVLGHGLPDILEDMQEIANATLRSLVNNMCLTGDTEVYRHSPQDAPKRQRRHREQASVTLDELWKQKGNHNSGLRRNVIRAVDTATGKIVGRRIADIHNNGVQDVYRIRTRRGYDIKATATHRFLDAGGDWRVVSEFGVGDCVAVNGSVVPLTKICMDCGASLSKATAIRCKLCAAKAPGSWNDQQARIAVYNRGALATTARARKLVKACRKETCENCGGAERLHIHHLDLDPWNCAPENLKTLCEPCHKAWHVRHGHFGDPFLHLYVDFDIITSVEYVGREQTYCLTMQGEPNFIANGFVSHNSIASGPQVVVDTSRLSPTENADEMYPWKRWYVASDMLTSSGPPVSFFQPQSNSQELLMVYSAISGLADDISAIPRYVTGESLKGGAGRTASGLSMLMNNSSKVLQTVASNVDIDVMKPSLTGLYDMIMLTDQSGLLTGDEQIAVNGVTVALQKESERQKQLQFLQITGNPIDAPILGELGRARVLRSVAGNMGLPDDIVPDDNTIEQRIKAREQLAKVQAMFGGDEEEGETEGGGSPGSRAQGQQVRRAPGARHSDNAPPQNDFQQARRPNGGVGTYGP